MAKKFRDLRAKMSKESLSRAHEKAQVMLSELPLAELRQARHFSQEQLARQTRCASACGSQNREKNGHVYLDSAPIY